MANEAVIIELMGYPKGIPIRLTVPNAVAISGGSVVKIIDPRTASGANLLTFPYSFGGIAAVDKEASDGAVDQAFYTLGIFDMAALGTTNINAGDYVQMSGANAITTPATQAAYLAALSGGAIIGKALETAGVNETIAVAIGVYT